MSISSVQAEAPELRTLPVRDLNLALGDFTNPRTITGLGKDDISELSRDIKERGLQVRPQVFELTKDGVVHWVIKDGQRRILALNLLKVDSVEVEVVGKKEYSPEVAAEMIMGALADVGHREGLSSYEQTAAAARLLSLGTSQTVIGNRIKRSKAWVSTMLAAWRKSTDELKAEWKIGKVTDEQFKDLANVPTEKQPEALADITSLREKGDRAAARKAAKEVSEKATGKPVPRKIEVVTWDPKTKREVVTKMPIKEAQKKGLVRNEKEVGPRPGVRSIEEYAKLRTLPLRGHRTPYVRGMLDMAAFAVGALSPEKFDPSWKGFLKMMASAMAKASAAASKESGGAKKEKGEKGVAKDKPKKGNAIVARAKAKAAAKAKKREPKKERKGK